MWCVAYGVVCVCVYVCVGGAVGVTANVGCVTGDLDEVSLVCAIV